jgi:hypothetical protein
MGASSSKSVTEQSADAYLAQTFHGSCNVTCTNLQSNINVDIINSVIGGNINLTQKCAVDANCAVSSLSDATSDVLYKAENSSNAKNSTSLFTGSIFNFDTATSRSRQAIKQNITQSTTEKCKLANLNQMNNVNILAANSQIGGSIDVAQGGSVQGECQLSNNLTAAAMATAMATNKSTSGKDKKGEKKGGGIGSIIGFIVVMIIVFIIAHMFTGGQKSRADAAVQQKVALARAQAGCPGGLKPIIDSETGLPIIDPKTMRPVCPPFLESPVINIDVGKLLNDRKNLSSK